MLLRFLDDRGKGAGREAESSRHTRIESPKISTELLDPGARVPPLLSFVRSIDSIVSRFSLGVWRGDCLGVCGAWVCRDLGIFGGRVRLADGLDEGESRNVSLYNGYEAL